MIKSQSINHEKEEDVDSPELKITYIHIQKQEKYVMARKERGINEASNISGNKRAKNRQVLDH